MDRRRFLLTSPAGALAMPICAWQRLQVRNSHAMCNHPPSGVS